MSHRSLLLFSSLAAALIAYALTPLVTRLAIRIGAVDHPDPRKVHSRPTPRLGGLSIIVAVGLVLLLAPLVGGEGWAIAPVLARGLVLGLFPIVAVSLVDDIRPVPARIKFLCHLTGAGLAVAAGVCLPDRVHVLGYELAIGFLAIPVSALWLAGITNAFNIIDGLDGLAAGLAFISAVAVSAVFVTAGQLSAAILPLSLAGAIAGFLPYNLYPARIFLGDTGATAVGFALGVVALKGGTTMSAGFAAATPLLIMGLPIADTVVAITRRLIHWVEHRAGGVFQPDCNHVHHRLLALGLNHQNAVWVLYGLGCLTAAVAYVSLFVSNRESALLLLALVTAGAIGLKRLGYDEFALVRRGTFLRFYEAPVLRWSMFVVFVDIAFVCLSAYLAVALKTDDWLLHSGRALAFRTAAFLIPLTIAVFWRAGIYEGSWRLATINDYVRASLACATVVCLGVVLCSWQFQNLPASLLVVYGLVNTLLVVGSRASYRVLLSAHKAAGPATTPTLLYGPGPSDILRARDLIERAGAFGLRPVGFLTQAGAGRGKLLAGLKICGSLDDLPMLTRSSGAKAVIFATPRATKAAVSRFEDLCRLANVVPYRLNIELEAMWEHDTDSMRPQQGLADAHRDRSDVAI
jgi:UDP-GlcNAc:undecaprenyl-phosphate/decaprenyl-phosphate GlcNAc-1-phosphate transferase